LRAFKLVKKINPHFALMRELERHQDGEQTASLPLLAW
jgi:hypothetical protein